MFCGAEGGSKRGGWSECPTCEDLDKEAMCLGLSVLQGCELINLKQEMFWQE